MRGNFSWKFPLLSDFNHCKIEDVVDSFDVSMRQRGSQSFSGAQIPDNMKFYFLKTDKEYYCNATR